VISGLISALILKIPGMETPVSMAVPEAGDRRPHRQVFCPVSVESETTLIQSPACAAGVPEVCRLVVNMPTRLLY
jgi:hypothetical protein